MMSTQTFPPRVEISEQPTPRWRFRYQAEGRSPPIQGVRSTKEQRSFPTIKLIGCAGPGVVIVSTVTKDEPFRVHADSLVGRGGTAAQDGMCRVQLAPGQTEVMFSNLGIGKVRRRDVQQALAVKQECQHVDPYGQGFGHKARHTHMDLSCLRLCFQVYLGTGPDVDAMLALAPIVSQPIADVKNNHELEICRMVPRGESYADGGDEPIVLLCEKVAKAGIRIRFFEESDDGDVVWEDFGVFRAKDVHKQCAITFRPPPYREPDLTEPVVVNVQLLKPSDGTVSEPVRFKYVPRVSTSTAELRPARKKQKTANGSYKRATAQRQNGQIELPPLASEPPPPPLPPPVTRGLNNLTSTANYTIESAPNDRWNIPVLMPDYYDVTEPLQPVPLMPTPVAASFTQLDQPDQEIVDSVQFVENFVQQVLNNTFEDADATMQSASQTHWATELQVLMDNPDTMTPTTTTTTPNAEENELLPIISIDDLSASLSDLIIRAIPDLQ